MKCSSRRKPSSSEPVGKGQHCSERGLRGRAFRIARVHAFALSAELEVRTNGDLGKRSIWLRGRKNWQGSSQGNRRKLVSALVTADREDQELPRAIRSSQEGLSALRAAVRRVMLPTGQYMSVFGRQEALEEFSWVESLSVWKGEGLTADVNQEKPVDIRSR